MGVHINHLSGIVPSTLNPLYDPQHGSHATWEYFARKQAIEADQQARLVYSAACCFNVGDVGKILGLCSSKPGSMGICNVCQDVTMM